MRWSDVTRVSLGHRGGVQLETADGTRLRISPIFYSDFDGTLEWLADRLAHAWPVERP
jgi:hypothetical protein